MIFEILSLETIVAFVFASVVLSLVPGPDNIFVMTNSALKGWKAGFYITLGLSSILVVHQLMTCNPNLVMQHKMGNKLSLINLSNLNLLIFILIINGILMILISMFLLT